MKKFCSERVQNMSLDNIDVFSQGESLLHVYSGFFFFFSQSLLARYNPCSRKHILFPHKHDLCWSYLTLAFSESHTFIKQLFYCKLCTLLNVMFSLSPGF